MSANDPHAHETPIKTPQQLILLVVLAFVVPVVSIILLAKFVISGYRAGGGSDVAVETVAQRIRPVAGLTIAEGGGAGAAPRSGEDVAKATCLACHQTGAANAPRIGDKAAWGKLAGMGLDNLVKSAIKGKGAMPPRGGVSDLSDFELARAIVYMTNLSGGNLKEPAAPKPPSPSNKK